MSEIASLIQELSLDNPERTTIKLGTVMLPLSYTTLYLITPKFACLDLITQAMFSLSLVILLSVASLFMSNIFRFLSKNDKDIFTGLFFIPSFSTFGVTLICEAFGNRKNLQEFIYILAGAFLGVFLLSLYLAYKVKKEMNLLKTNDCINVGNNTSEQGT